jgi:ribonuclease R
MVPIRDLTDDYYEFDEKNFCVVGRHTNTRYRLGDNITIQVARANLERKQLDFAIVDDRHPRRDEDILGKKVSAKQAINAPTPKGRDKGKSKTKTKDKKRRRK